MKGLGKALSAAGVLGAVGGRFAGDANNPYLTTDQKLSRAGKAVVPAAAGTAVAAGASAAGAAAAGAAFGTAAAGPVGFLAGAAAAAWTIADNELDLSDRISDGIDAVAGGIADTAGTFKSGVDGLVDGLKGGPDPVAEGVETLKDVLGL